MLKTNLSAVSVCGSRSIWTVSAPKGSPSYTAYTTDIGTINVVRSNRTGQIIKSGGAVWVEVVKALREVGAVHSEYLTRYLESVRIEERRARFKSSR